MSHESMNAPAGSQLIVCTEDFWRFLFGSIFVAEIIVQNQRTRSKFELDLYFFDKIPVYVFSIVRVCQLNF